MSWYDSFLSAQTEQAEFCDCGHHLESHDRWRGPCRWQCIWCHCTLTATNYNHRGLIVVEGQGSWNR